MHPSEPSEYRDHLPFAQHHAFIIGIDAYTNVSPLRTAVNDARTLADVLSAQQHFRVHPPLFDATGAEIRALLHTTLEHVGKDDRAVFYFAGHGVAADGEDGPAGYIVPADADPTDVKTFVAMADLQQALDALPCRHLLLVLDCCFSGAFKWSTQHRAIGTLMPKRIYKERFDRFIADPAWQVITSAAYDQKALDVLDGKPTGDRGSTQAGDHLAHSPFARALFEALAGAADVKGDREGDGVITATELYAYIRDQVEPRTIEADQRLRQTPGFFPLKKHDKGEFIFLHPRHRLNLPPTPNHSPYKGLASFDEGDRLLFYGRDRVIEALRAKAKDHKLLVISGASGTGKSSVVKAGLLPVLRAEGCRILPVIRPGAHPLAALEQALAEAHTGPADGAAAQPPGTPKSILLIDQFEEVITRCADPKERTQFDARLRRLLDEDPSIHRLILTVRADFEPQLNGGALKQFWGDGRYVVPPFSLEELKEVIVMPTIQEVLIFDPPQLVDEIIAEVVQSPGALPLLSYALSELYEAYRTSGRQDRALRKDDYDRLGGVMGALRTKADALYTALPHREQNTMRKILLRMVSVEGDLASKRVPMDDLVYSEDEDPLVRDVIERLVDARLIAKGRDYIEPAHDALVRAWKTLHEWVFDAGKDKLILGTKLSAAANDFAKSKNGKFLWNNSPNLPVVQEELKNPRRWFNAKEIAFVRKSTRRKTINRRWVVGITATVIAALSFATYYSNEQKGIAEDQLNKAQRGQSLLLSERARQENNANHFVNGALLALEALPRSMVKPDRPYVAAAELQLYAALAPLVEHVVLSGHAGRVTFGGFSPDDTRVVTASYDGTARIWDATTGRLLVTLEGHRSRVAHAAFSPDGRRLVTASNDNSAKLWDVQSGKEIVSFGGLQPANFADSFYHAAFSPDGSRIALASSGSQFSLWDAETGSLIAKPSTNAFVAHAIFSPDGRLIVTTDRFGGPAQLWDAKTGAVIGQLSGHEAGHYYATFSPDSRSIVTASADGTAGVWNTDTQERRLVLRGHTDKVFHADFSPDGRQVVTVSKDGTGRIWATNSGKSVAVLAGHTGEVRHAAFSPDGGSVVTSSRDGTAKLWDARNGSLVTTLAGHAEGVTHAVFSNDGRRVLSTGDKTARVWNLSGERDAVTLSGAREPIGAAVFSPSGDLVATGSGILTSVGETSTDSVVRLWSTKTGALVGELRGHTQQIKDLQFTRDGRRLVSVSWDKSVRVWDVMNHRTLQVILGPFVTAALSPGDDIVATGSSNGDVGLWNLSTGAKLADLPGHREPVVRLDFSLDGRLLASASWDHTGRIWDVGKHSQVSVLTGHSDGVRWIAFSPDGSRVATAAGHKEYNRESDDNTVRVWDSRTGREILTLSDHQEQVNHVVFSPDGRLIATSSGYDAGDGVTGTRSKDNSARIWDANTGHQVLVLKDHSGPVTMAAFAPGNDRIVTASEDHTARVWRLDTGETIAILPHGSRVNLVRFDLSGSRALTAAGYQYGDTHDNTARIWRLQPDTQALIDHARRSLGSATLTDEDRKRYLPD